MSESKYRRVVLKLSGEAFADRSISFGIDSDVVQRIAAEVTKARADLGVEIAIVVGGGNIFRGMIGATGGMDRARADYMGMLATVINALALQDALEQLGQPTRVQTAITMSQVAEPYIPLRAIRHLEKGRFVIFAAGNGNPYFTTDTTAILRAAEMGCDAVLKATDVDGVYTADPNVVPEARKLARVSYDEMLEMAALGAKVLQARSVEFAKKFAVPVHVRSTFKPDPGTLVTREDHSMEDVVVTGITHDRGQAKLSILRVPDRPGIASQVFGGLAKENIVVDMIVQNIGRDGSTDISFTLPRGDRQRAETVLAAVAKDIGAAGVTADDRIARVSIVGVGMRSHSGVAARMFATLSNENINIQMISTSEIAVSCVIEDKYAELAVRALHDAFELGKEPAA
jgi:uridylate kinase